MSSLGIIIDGFYIDCLAPGNVINDRRHDEPPFFLSFSSLANPFGRGHSITTWTRLGRKGSTNVCFCSRLELKIVHAGEGGCRKLAKFCQRSSWMPHNVAYSSTARYSSSNSKAGPAEHKGSVEICSNTILQKSNNFPYIWIVPLIYEYEFIWLVVPTNF